ncbi:MAG: YraN family protein [Bdellovibrionia bacterium]
MSKQIGKLHFGLEMEEKGAQWLEGRYPSLTRLVKNYRWKGGELDLVFEDRTLRKPPELVIVEVRARKSGALVDGVVSITAPKRMRLARTIRHFLSRYNGPAHSVRLDVLAWDGANWTHLRDVRLEGAAHRQYH